MHQAPSNPTYQLRVAIYIKQRRRRRRRRRRDGAQVPFEVIVNIDHPRDADIWLDWAYNKTQGVVVPVFSYNVHEIRWAGQGRRRSGGASAAAGSRVPRTRSRRRRPCAPGPQPACLPASAARRRSYNRAAAVARAPVITVAQDDQIFNMDANCTWMRNLVDLFRKHPRLGAIGHRGWCGSLAARAPRLGRCTCCTRCCWRRCRAVLLATHRRRWVDCRHAPHPCTHTNINVAQVRLALAQAGLLRLQVGGWSELCGGATSPLPRRQPPCDARTLAARARQRPCGDRKPTCLSLTLPLAPAFAGPSSRTPT